MKKIIKTLFVLGLAMTSIACKKDSEEPVIPGSNYELTPDGKTLVRWNVDISSLDMQADKNLRNVTRIEESVFSRWGQLTSIKFPDNLESIGKDAFQATSITSVVLPTNITRIEEGTFALNPKLKTVSLNEGLKFLGYAAFAGCTSIETIKLPSTLAVISSRAFERTGLYDITIPKSVTKIEAQAFFKSSSLTAITFESTTPPVLEENVFGYITPLHIYVPASSVDAYKAVPSLANYVSIIKPKP